MSALNDSVALKKNFFRQPNSTVAVVVDSIVAASSVAASFAAVAVIVAAFAGIVAVVAGFVAVASVAWTLIPMTLSRTDPNSSVGMMGAPRLKI